MQLLQLCAFLDLSESSSWAINNLTADHATQTHLCELAVLGNKYLFIEYLVIVMKCSHQKWSCKGSSHWKKQTVQSSLINIQAIAPIPGFESVTHRWEPSALDITSSLPPWWILFKQCIMHIHWWTYHNLERKGIWEKAKRLKWG